MRKFLMSLTVLAGATAAAQAAQASPAAVSLPIFTGPAHVQSIQYYEDWRHREWRRHEAYERWRRHEEARRWHHYRNF